MNQPTKDTRALCVLPWIHMNIATDGAAYPCCHADMKRPLGSLHASTLDELWNSPGLRRIRLDMLAGRESPECRRCHEMERSRFLSPREKVNRRFARHLSRVANTREDGSLPGLDLAYMDIRFSNACNFRCRTCGPEASSAWHEDAKALNWWGFLTPRETSAGGGEALWRRIEELAPGLEEVYFAGGEPMLIEEHVRVLRLLARRGLFHVRLRYNTNFSALRDETLDLWSRFESVTVAASLDGSGRRGEYLRTGQNWELVLRNRERLTRRCPAVRLVLASTLSLFNALHLPDLHAEWLGRGWAGPEDVLLALLQDPSPYRIQALPPRLKDAVTNRYRRYIDETLRPYGERGRPASDRIEGALRFMRAQDLSHELPRFRRLTRRLDRIRGEDFSAAFPEMASLLDAS